MKNNPHWQMTHARIPKSFPRVASFGTAKTSIERAVVRRLSRPALFLLAILCLAEAAHSAVFTSGNASVSPGQQVAVPITVSGFTDVTSLQFTLQWNSDVLQYDSTGNYGLPGLAGGNFGYSSANPNQLTVGWDDPNAVGVSQVSGSTIFSVNFNAVGNPGSSSLINFTDSPTAREVSVLFSVSDFGEVVGTVDVVPEPVNLALGAFGCMFAGTAAVRRLRQKRPVTASGR